MLGNPIRQGFHTVTPYLIAQDMDKLVDFVKQAFGATETFRARGDAGGMHIEVKIGDSMIMIGGGGPGRVEPMPAMLHLYVEDVDALYQRALQAGAVSIAEPTDHADGDRRGGVKDAFGNMWYIATHKPG